MNKNAIAMVTDRGIFPAAAFLSERLSSLNPRNDTDIFLFCDCEKSLAEARAFGCRANLRRADFDKMDFGPRHNPASGRQASYFRLCLPRLLSTDYSRVLYLDVDVFPSSRRLFDFFDLDTKGYPVAAARAIALYFRFRRLNSGVMLLDVDSYRTQRIEERCFEMIRALPKLPVVNEQTILNHVLEANWLELSPSFNLNCVYHDTELKEAFSPQVLHYVGGVKQWSTPTYAELHESRAALREYLAASPWSDFFERMAGPKNQQQPRKKRLADLGTGFPAFLHYLRTTKFADVEQGITKPRMDLLPV